MLVIALTWLPLLVRVVSSVSRRDASPAMTPPALARVRLTAVDFSRGGHLMVPDEPAPPMWPIAVSVVSAPSAAKAATIVASAPALIGENPVLVCAMLPERPGAAFPVGPPPSFCNLLLIVFGAPPTEVPSTVSLR